MLFRTLTFTLLLFCGLSYSADARSRSIPYTYILEAENDILSGHIPYNAGKGSKVVADQTEVVESGEESAGGEQHYLKVIISIQSSQKLKTTPITAHQTSNHQTITQGDPFTPNHSGQAFAARMTGSQKLAQTGSSGAISTNSLRAEMLTQEDVSVVTTNARPGTHPQTGITNARPGTRSQTGTLHNVHILNTNPGTNIPSAGQISPSFRNIHPHGHNIHITHLAKDSVHPVVNKRSVRRDNIVSRKRRNVGHNFAISPEDFQPQHLRPTSGSNKPIFVVMATDTFYVDPVDNFVKLNNTEYLEDKHIHLIEFYVYLVDENGVAVSNPLPFLVYIDRPEALSSSSYPTGPAVFAGVLVLCVICFAVAIPLVTRAKRRYKEGKPMFKIGSHPSRADLESAELENKGRMTSRPSEPNWYGNNYFYSYDDEVAKERSDFSSELKQYSEPPTLQLNKKRKEPLSEKSSSSGVDVSSTGGAEGVNGEDTYSQRL